MSRARFRGDLSWRVFSAWVYPVDRLLLLSRPTTDPRPRRRL
jgi:hypothetical protein